MRATVLSVLLLALVANVSARPGPAVNVGAWANDIVGALKVNDRASKPHFGLLPLKRQRQGKFIRARARALRLLVSSTMPSLCADTSQPSIHHLSRAVFVASRISNATLAEFCTSSDVACAAYTKLRKS